jgi:hypothetical protein
MQDNAVGSMFLAATKTLLDAPAARSPVMVMLQLLPKWLAAHVATAMCHMGWGARYERARDVLWGISDALARNYCAAHPDVGTWKTPPGVVSQHQGHMLFPKELIPSDNSILAALMQARHKCALH